MILHGSFRFFSFINGYSNLTIASPQGLAMPYTRKHKLLRLLRLAVFSVLDKGWPVLLRRKGSNGRLV